MGSGEGWVAWGGVSGDRAGGEDVRDSGPLWRGLVVRTGADALLDAQGGVERHGPVQPGIARVIGTRTRDTFSQAIACTAPADMPIPLAHPHHGRPSRVSASPRLAVPAHPLHTVAALSFICHVRLLATLSPPHVNNYIAEIDALLAERRDYIARNGELTTSVGAFRAAYASSQDEVKKKSDEIAKLLAELHALKVWPFSPVPLSPHRSPRDKRNVSSVSWMATELYSPQT